MYKIFEQCTVDGELTPELLKRKQELDAKMESEIANIDANKGNIWVPKERQYAEVRQKYDDMWEQELIDAGYVVRPVFESTELWYDALSALNEAAPVKPVKEAMRSSAEIEAEIARLQKELEAAKVSEKKAGYGTELPTEVWYWDMYINPRRKGSWTSIDNDVVFETEEAAIDGAWTLLSELDDEGELRGDPDDYTIDTVKIPISKVSAEALRWSGLDHLI